MEKLKKIVSKTYFNSWSSFLGNIRNIPLENNVKRQEKFAKKCFEAIRIEKRSSSIKICGYFNMSVRRKSWKELIEISLLILWIFLLMSGQKIVWRNSCSNRDAQ